MKDHGADPGVLKFLKEFLPERDLGSSKNFALAEVGTLRVLLVIIIIILIIIIIKIY